MGPTYDRPKEPTETKHAETEHAADSASEETAADNSQSEGGHRESEGSGADKTAEEVNEREGELIALKFGANKSLRYHSARRSFLDTMHRTVMAVAAIGGSAAFVALIGDKILLAKTAAATIAVVAALDVVIGFSERARHHDDLYRRSQNIA